MKLLQWIGVCLYWLAWPAYQVYLRLSERTRVVVVHDGKVLVMRQWVSDGKYSLPGGGLHRGEAPITGARRELHEETGMGVAGENIAFVGTREYRANGHHFTYHVFAVLVPRGKPLRRQWYEVAELKWIAPGELNSHNAAADTLQSVQLVRECTRLLQ